MKKIKLFFCLLIVFCIAPLVNVSAEECSAEQLKTLKEKAGAIQVDVEFDYESLNAGFFDKYIVSVYGLTEELYVMTDDFSKGFFYENAVDGKITASVSYGSSSLDVYSTKCSGVIKEVKLNLKKYNVYSQYQECDGIDPNELDVCAEFYDGDLTYNKFVKIINDYKNNNVSFSEKEKSILDYVKEYYYILIGVGVVFVVFVIFLIIRRRKRNVLD